MQTQNFIHEASLSSLLSTLEKHAYLADETGQTQPESLRALRSSGLLGSIIPTEYGGKGETIWFASKLIEQLATVDPSIAIVVHQHLLVVTSLLNKGSEKQKRTYLPKLSSGEWIAASAWSETGSGAGKQTVGTKNDEGNWVINGVKTFTTGAGLADLYLVLVQTVSSDAGTEAAQHGQTFFLIEKEQVVAVDTQSGLSGMRGSSTRFIEFHRSVLTSDHILGEVGGSVELKIALRESGLTLGAISVGISEAAFRIALDYVERKGLAASQSLQVRLSELHMWIDAARALVDKVAERSSDNLKLSASQSKILASEVSEKVCREVQQIVGGTGYMRGHKIERLYRDARGVSLMGPVNYLAREMVGREIVSEPFRF
ncbi:acyl-CoA dehydrogenase family protein [Paenibacillus sp. N3.4]|uniref:acyl-CoA dehydrogenase family protein n=1 Tax=Paenibacillus sp. N3.4 TaxID=2603222 RepID=UPI00164FB529|nr:acyl-CoA dehydrogenase family protein [Paenibacillus sp. N3.4]